MRIPTLALAAFLAVGCQGGDQPNIEFIQDMMESPAIKAQEYDESSPGGSGMRLPPENTVPVGFSPYKYAQDFQGAVRDLKNPFGSDFSESVLMMGLKQYETHCAICHGSHGEGGEKLSVSEFMALKPPALTSEKVQKMSDGQLYHIITMGQGVMGGYASHIPQKDRWQVVSFIRSLNSKKE